MPVLSTSRLSATASTSHIYFIEAVGLGLIKIGYANDVSERMRKLRPGCPAPLKLLGRLPGGIREERDLHRQLAKQRAHGEWFRRCPEIDALLQGADKTEIQAAKAAPRKIEDTRTAEQVAADIERMERERNLLLAAGYYQRRGLPVPDEIAARL